MKKFVLFLLAALPIFAQTLNPPLDRLSLFLSYNVNNTVKLSNSGSTTIYRAEGSPVLGAEINIADIKGSSIGIGAEYQFSGNVTGLNGHFNNIPIYLYFDVSLSQSISLLPRLSIKIGHSFLNVDDNFHAPGATSAGRMYYGLGIASQVYEELLIRVLYTVNQGKINYNSNDYLFDNEKINIGFYITF